MDRRLPAALSEASCQEPHKEKLIVVCEDELFHFYHLNNFRKSSNWTDDRRRSRVGEPAVLAR